MGRSRPGVWGVERGLPDQGWDLPRRGQRSRGGGAETSVKGGRAGAGEACPPPIVSCGVAQTLRVVVGFRGGGPGKEASWALTAQARQG